MNRKQFLFLLIALAVLGAVGAAIFWQNVTDYRSSGSKIGAKLLPGLKVADVSRIELRDAKRVVTLQRKENYWVVEQRESYPADFKAISDLIIKLSDLKITQADTIGESLLPRVELVAPGKGEGSGTLVELKDAAGATLQAVILGRTVLKKDPGNPLPAAQDGVPAGRYVRVLSGKEQVVVVSDPLTNAVAEPGRWLDRDFAKVERVKTLTVAGDTGWKITRDLEWGQWKFAGGAGELDASSAVGAVNALSQLSFSDVAIGLKPEDHGPITTVIAETFENLTYTLKISKQTSAPDYLLNISVAGEPPAAREIEKGEKEKPEDKERRDKDYAESRKRLELRVARDKARSAWTYLVEAKQAAPFLKTRAELMAQRKPAPDDRKR